MMSSSCSSRRYLAAFVNSRYLSDIQITILHTKSKVINTEPYMKNTAYERKSVARLTKMCSFVLLLFSASDACIVESISYSSKLLGLERGQHLAVIEEGIVIQGVIILYGAVSIGKIQSHLLSQVWCNKGIKTNQIIRVVYKKVKFYCVFSVISKLVE